MTIGTTVTWDAFLSPEDNQSLRAKAAVMATEGKTDNISVNTYAGGIEGAMPLSTVRQWTTLADAQEWLDFLVPYNPVSAVINS